MKVSRTWLQTYFDAPLPSAEEIADKLTFHAFEIEEIVPVGDDSVVDVKVTPNRGHDALCHRGIAKELSVILNLPLKSDPLRDEVNLEPKTDFLTAEIAAEDLCYRFSAAFIKGVKIGPSPEWLKVALESIGQRSINNVVDATNYVMFNLGQPLHAFDANKLSGEKKKIVVKVAPEGEKFMALDNKEYSASGKDLFITDGNSGALLGTAGVKGGKTAEVDAGTTNLILEAANFNGVSVRKTSQRFKLRTDASVRFENQISPELTVYGLKAVVDLISEIAGGKLEGYIDVYPNRVDQMKVSVTLDQINSRLGLSISESEIEEILQRFDFTYEKNDKTFEVSIPFERWDLLIKEDLIEEIGRIYGYEKIKPVVPTTRKPAGINKRFFYADKIRKSLLERGFSEVYTTSFRSAGSVELANAVASDKNFLRQNLTQNLKEALTRNSVNAPLLNLSSVNIFEIGTVFEGEKEIYALAFGSWMGEGGKKENAAKVFVEETKAELEKVLGTHLEAKPPSGKEAIFEADLGALLEKLPDPVDYENLELKISEATYKAFSQYPFILRDIAVWVPASVTQGELEAMIRGEAGELLERLDHFDSFEKEGKVSHAFHLVFQSYERTLSDNEINEVMQKVVSKLESSQDFKVR